MNRTTLAVNVFDEGNSSSQTNQRTTQPNQNETSQEQTFDKKPLVSTTGQNQGQETNMMSYAPWIGVGLVAVVILVALFAIIRKLNKKA